MSQHFMQWIVLNNLLAQRSEEIHMRPGKMILAATACRQWQLRTGPAVMLAPAAAPDQGRLCHPGPPWCAVGPSAVTAVHHTGRPARLVHRHHIVALEGRTTRTSRQLKAVAVRIFILTHVQYQVHIASGRKRAKTCGQGQDWVVVRPHLIVHSSSWVPACWSRSPDIAKYLLSSHVFLPLVAERCRIVAERCRAGEERRLCGPRGVFRLKVCQRLCVCRTAVVAQWTGRPT